MMALLYLLSAWIIFQLVFPACCVAYARWRGRERVQEQPEAPPPDYACIITAYRNAAIAQPLVHSLLQQSYPHLHIYLVADACREAGAWPQDARLKVLQPATPLNLKIRSIRYAVDRFIRPHRQVVIFDADNLAHPHFLAEISRYHRSGFQCVQGRRTAKNTDTDYAAADSLGELYKNYIERYAPYLLGGSAVISGSGMSTDAALYQAYLEAPEIREGHLRGKKMLQEDKILQNFLLRRNIAIAYAWQAVCFDEKTDNARAVRIQRSRWIFSYFQNIPNALGILLGGSARQFFFGVVTLALPLFLQLGLTLLLLVVTAYTAPWLSVALLTALTVFTLNVLWVLHLSKARAALWRALWKAPQFLWQQVLSLGRMRHPDKHFHSTEHHKTVSVEELEEP
jgi:cellulose synthase/poly-beta-1,6-N-acetylglucosamine synthase-like glycosyltransferase